VSAKGRPEREQAPKRGARRLVGGGAMEASSGDWLAIQRLFIRYATSLDHGDIDTVVSCFTADCVLESPVLGTFEGHAGLRDFAGRTARLLREQGVQFRHVVSNLVADVDGDTAKARCYLLDFRTRDGRTELLSPGEYVCDLRRESGQWRFARRVVLMDRAFGVSDL
jgi:3-phenylpropionate/cinnamic acid dioxygenase small subunit